MPQIEAVRQAGFVPLEVKAGDLVLIHGQVDHLSLDNSSGQSRHTFQLHVVDGPSSGVTWHPRNWLQYPPGQAFPSLVDPEPVPSGFVRLVNPPSCDADVAGYIVAMQAGRTKFF